MNYLYEPDKVIAIIPARSGSKGVIDKNIADIKGFPLIAYSIAAGKLVKGISEVIVSTDSGKYADIARQYGAEIPFLRPAEISKSDSRDIEYLQHALNAIFKRDGKVSEYVVLLRPTTPMRVTRIIEKAIGTIKDIPDATAVVSVHPIDECPYKWMVISDGGYLESPFAELEPDDVNLPRQGFKKVYEPDGYVDVLRSRVVLEEGFVYGRHAVPLRINERIVDIDAYKDIEQINNSDIENSELYSYLMHLRGATNVGSE